MEAVSATFPTAPRGRRIYVASIAAAVCSLVAVSISSYSIIARHHSNSQRELALAFIAPGLTGLVGLLMSYREARLTAQFRIEDNVLVLARRRYPLLGATEVVRDPQVLKGARKLWGNGGVTAIRGKYRSKRIGTFEAFLTDTEHAVLVRWPERVVAVSPADSEFFIYSARKAAGIAT